jgi:hypothetical protein
LEQKESEGIMTTRPESVQRIPLLETRDGLGEIAVSQANLVLFSKQLDLQLESLVAKWLPLAAPNTHRPAAVSRHNFEVK